MNPNITADTRLRPEYTCHVPLTFGGDVVGAIHVEPERLRQAIFKARLREALGSDPKLSSEQLKEIWPKLAQFNSDAVFSTMFACETLKQKRQSDRFLENLAAEFFLLDGELSAKRQKYLAQARLRLLESSSIQEWVKQKLESRQSAEVKDFIQLLTPGRSGRTPSVDHKAREQELIRTKDLFAEHRPKLSKAKDRYSFFKRHLKHAYLGERIVAAGLDAWWFSPSGGHRLPDAWGMAAELMAAEGWGGEHALKKLASKFRKRR